MQVVRPAIALDSRMFGKRRFVHRADEASTAGSLLEAVTALVANGAREIYSLATHGVFSGPALERIMESPITEVVVARLRLTLRIRLAAWRSRLL